MVLKKLAKKGGYVLLTGKAVSILRDQKLEIPHLTLGRIKERNSRLNIETVEISRISWLRLFHSFIQYGKKELAKYSEFVLNCLIILEWISRLETKEGTMLFK